MDHKEGINRETPLGLEYNFKQKNLTEAICFFNRSLTRQINTDSTPSSRRSAKFGLQEKIRIFDRIQLYALL